MGKDVFKAFVVKKIKISYNPDNLEVGLSGFNFTEFENELAKEALRVLKETETVSVKDDVMYITYQVERTSSEQPLKTNTTSDFFIIRNSVPFDL